MLRDIDHFYLDKPEPIQGCLIALRQIILGLNDHITAHWKYRLPFFYYKGKMFCYLWLDKKTKEPYIGVVKGSEMDHPLLELGNRSLIKVLRLNPHEDLPIDVIESILKEAMDLYKI